jgi:hypothetical protein
MKSPKVLLAALALGAGLVSIVLRPGDAFAGVTVCRTDPVATLSNGGQISMADSISDTQSDIKNVNFVLHIPTGMTVTKVQYDSTYASLETFSWTADQPAGSYKDVTTVTTGKTGMSVTASASVTSMACSHPSTSVNGKSGSAITVSFTC